MNTNKQKQQSFLRRKRRVRAKIWGTKELPRLAVHRSLKHLSAQLIDDNTGRTIVAMSDAKLSTAGTKTTKATAVGQALAQAALAAGITRVVFDRSGYRFHGRVKALAAAARTAGLKF